MQATPRRVASLAFLLVAVSACRAAEKVAPPTPVASLTDAQAIGSDRG
ncbi:MAG: hypothetical protein K8S98_00975 [Planctomycetes bacterium]|nr:hypothetical protein [Planctomycetota bacterium]